MTGDALRFVGNSFIIRYEMYVEISKQSSHQSNMYNNVRLKICTNKRKLKLFFLTVGKANSAVRSPPVNLSRLNQSAKGDSKALDELNLQVIPSLPF